MSARKILWAILIGTSLLGLLPLASATPSSPPAQTVTSSTSLPTIHGSVTNCTTTVTCTYSFSNSNGTGWANSTLSKSYALTIALKLPGENVSTSNISFSATTSKTTYSYPNTTFWIVGTFLGTDENTGHVLYGSTDTNFTETCHPVFKWCHYTYTTNNGTIAVHLTNAEPTSTAIVCSPTFTHPLAKVSCKVTVTNDWIASNFPTGKVHLSDGGTGLGTFSNKGTCALSNGTCSFSFRSADNDCGLVYLTATYPGSAAYWTSSAVASIDVYVSGGC